MNIWENPELIRHVRMEMRPRRMAIAATVAIVLCLAVWILAAQANDHPNDREYLQAVFTTLAIGQAAILVLWSFSACTQSIANERVMKTYDFLRTTRLSSGELLSGMLFGIPIMPYFVVTLTYGITAAAGLLGGFKFAAIAATYFFMILVAITVSLLGLAISMMIAKPRAAGGLALVWLWVVSAIGASAPHGVFPALQSLMVVPALLPLFGVKGLSTPEYVHFFGLNAPQYVVTLVLYASASAWLILMLVRNLKREREDVKLLSRWQGIGFAVFVNVMIFGLLDTRELLTERIGYGGPIVQSPAGQGVSMATIGFLIVNMALFYAVGLMTLSTPERLKVWVRTRTENAMAILGDDGPPWPWMLLMGALAIVLFAVESRMTPGIEAANWKIPVWEIVVLLAYAMRDVMFLQWCTLTRMKDAVAKGLALLLLQYFVVSTVLAIFHTNDKAWQQSLAVLTPVMAFSSEHRVASLAGAALQLAIAAVFVYLIEAKFRKRAAMAAGANG